MADTEYVESEYENIPCFDAPQGMALLSVFERGDTALDASDSQGIVGFAMLDGFVGPLLLTRDIRSLPS